MAASYDVMSKGVNFDLTPNDLIQDNIRAQCDSGPVIGNLNRTRKQAPATAIDQPQAIGPIWIYGRTRIPVLGAPAGAAARKPTGYREDGRT